jgi:ATP synthase protein I
MPSIPSTPAHRGEMSQDSERSAAHRSHVAADGLDSKPVAALRPAIDPAARATKRMYHGMSASAAGLELGIAVGLGALFGSWLDGKLGTEPWMMLAFLIIGVIAGFRGVLRAVARADRAASRE